MSDAQSYQLQETIEGVTFTYRDPGQDPSFSQVNGPTGDGNFEDVRLWAVGDSPDMFLMDAETPSNVTRLMTYGGPGKFWRYRINTGSQRWQRRKPGQGWSQPPRPVSDLRIRIDGEVEHPVTEVRPTGPSGEEGTLIIHPGSTCRMIWNPATRRYTKVCTNP